MTARTFRRVDSGTFRPPLTTRDTVPIPTPAAAATSAIVGRAGVRTGVPPERRCPVGSDSNADWAHSYPGLGVRQEFAKGGRAARRAGPVQTPAQDRLIPADQGRCQSGPSWNDVGTASVGK